MTQEELKESFEDYMRKKYPWVDLGFIEPQGVYFKKETNALFDLWRELKEKEVGSKAEIKEPEFKWAVARSLYQLEANIDTEYFEAREELLNSGGYKLLKIPLYEAKIYQWYSKKEKFVFEETLQDALLLNSSSS